MNFQARSSIVTSLSAFALITFFTSPVFAAEAPARCYTFSTTNVPDRESHPAPRIEHWCYQPVHSAAGGLYIYNADHDKVRPELALVRLPNGTLTHGSLQAGKVTMHSVRTGGFNPFPVPLAEPSRADDFPAPATPAFRESAHQVLGLLLLAQSAAPPTLTVTPGNYSAQASVLPWRGFWWPNKGLPMVTPLSKYDTFVASRDRNPGAAAWEASHHVSHGLWWEGHCNGWAAAAIMRAEPRAPMSDPNTGVTFSVSDQKGVLTEADYCASASMFGHRNDGRGDPSDVHPDVFHQTLVYYIGNLHKLIAMDEHSDPVVDNRVISAYNMQIVASGPNQVTVTTTLRVHNYDASRVEVPGVAPSYSGVYRYVLQLDANGNVTGGRWLTKNPDFLWVPLSPGKCSSGNPNLSESFIGSITR